MRSSNLLSILSSKNLAIVDFSSERREMRAAITPRPASLLSLDICYKYSHYLKPKAIHQYPHWCSRESRKRRRASPGHFSSHCWSSVARPDLRSNSFKNSAVDFWGKLQLNQFQAGHWGFIEYRPPKKKKRISTTQHFIDQISTAKVPWKARIYNIYF